MEITMPHNGEPVWVDQTGGVLARHRMQGGRMGPNAVKGLPPGGVRFASNRKHEAHPPEFGTDEAMGLAQGPFLLCAAHGTYRHLHYPQESGHGHSGWDS